MIRVFDIALKDLLLLVRDFKTFMFALIMPILFTFLFGYATGGFGGGSDPRLPIGFLDEDGGRLSRELRGLLATSDVVRLAEDGGRSAAELEELVGGGDLAAAIIVPHGYGRAIGGDNAVRLILIADLAAPAGTTVQAETLASANRLDSAVRTAVIIADLAGDRAPFDYAFRQALAAWDDPPIAVKETISPAIAPAGDQGGSFARTSPGMMLQFAVAGLLTSAQIIVSERKSLALQRLLTTAARRLHILLGHYLAILVLVSSQFFVLMAFGQWILKVQYGREPGAVLLVASSAALCIAALGLLIGILARSDEQAVVFSLVPMFVLSGLGGVWVPLEVAGPAFQLVGHLTPLAWAMDGFENIVVRGLGLETVLIPAAALAGYAVLFLGLAAWRLYAAEER